MKNNNDEFLWSQFCRLGERIGDGDLDKDELWMHKEYKRLAKILIPDYTKMETQIRKDKNLALNKRVKELIKDSSCHHCLGELKQSRSGSKVLICVKCKTRYRMK